jgi:formate dehydrogenase subunit gamma
VTAPAPDRVLRFSRTERWVHWTFTALFLALLATGLVLWVPPLATTVGKRELMRRLHIWTGLALIPVPLAIGIVGDRRRVLRTARELDRFDADDRAFVRGRPSRPDRFNGGQRLNAWWTVASAVLFLASGIVQWQWPSFPAGWRRGASELHDLLVVAGVVILAGHVYLATVHRTTRPALRGIVTGWVRGDWSRAKHPRWEP